jgi:hypothetical protein
MLRRRPSLSCTVRRLLHDFVTLARLAVTSRAHLAAENLFLRKQLALYQERRTKPRRPDPSTRVALVSYPDYWTGARSSRSSSLTRSSGGSVPGELTLARDVSGAIFGTMIA